MIFFFFLQVESFLLQQLGLVGSSNCLMGISKPPELLPVPSYILASWSFLVEFFLKITLDGDCNPTNALLDMYNMMILLPTLVPISYNEINNWFCCLYLL